MCVTHAHTHIDTRETHSLGFVLGRHGRQVSEFNTASPPTQHETKTRQRAVGFRERACVEELGGSRAADGD